MLLALKPSFGLEYAVIISYVSFVVMFSCAPNSDIYIYTGMWYILFSRITHATLRHTKNVSDSRTVIRYAELPYMTSGLQVMCVSTHKLLIRRDCDAYLEP